MVMNQFSPPPTMTEVSGKFIMFASSIEKVHMEGGKGGKDHGKDGGKGIGGKGKDAGCHSFAMWWGLNADAQKKLYNLSPEARALVINGFSPQWYGQDVSGKFIMYAASIEKDPVYRPPEKRQRTQDR